MEEIILQAKYRQVIGKQVKAIRREGRLPAVIYGHNVESIPISLDSREVTRMLPSISSSLLVVVEVDGEKHTALVRDRQRHPVTGSLLHMDFLEVSMTERLRTTVSIILEGEAPATSDYGGIVVSGQENLEVECLPGDLPDRITVDVSSLEEIGDAIYVRDLVLSSKVDILTDPDEIVVVISAPVIEEEPEEEEIEPGLEEPEVIERGRKEEEEEES